MPRRLILLNTLPSEIGVKAHEATTSLGNGNIHPWRQWPSTMAIGAVREQLRPNVHVAFSKALLTTCRWKGTFAACRKRQPIAPATRPFSSGSAAAVRFRRQPWQRHRHRPAVRTLPPPALDIRPTRELGRAPRASFLRWRLREERDRSSILLRLSR